MGNKPTVVDPIEQRIAVLTKVRFAKWTMIASVLWAISGLSLVGFILSAMYFENSCSGIVCAVTNCCPLVPSIVVGLRTSFIIVLACVIVLEVILAILRKKYKQQLRNEHWLTQNTEIEVI